MKLKNGAIVFVFLLSISAFSEVRFACKADDGRHVPILSEENGEICRTFDNLPLGRCAFYGTEINLNSDVVAILIEGYGWETLNLPASFKTFSSFSGTYLRSNDEPNLVNPGLLSLAKPGVSVIHCRKFYITDEY